MKTYTQEPEKQDNVINEALVAYQVTPANPMALIFAATKGVKAKVIYDLVTISSHKKDFFADLLNLSVKTLDRYTAEDKNLNPSNSEIVLKLMLLYRKGKEVFGSITSFNKWLDKPCVGLGSAVPVKFMYTSGGIDLIFDELVRIEYGDLA